MIQSAINRTIGSVAAISAIKRAGEVKTSNVKQQESTENKNNISTEISYLREVLVKHFDEQKAAAANQNLQEQAQTAQKIQDQKNQVWNSILEQVKNNQGNKPIPKKSETMKKENK